MNHSLLQTMGRSLSTSLTVIFTLSAMALFGGASTRLFAVALLVGIVSGTYSSIFNASMLLVLWEIRRVQPLVSARSGCQGDCLIRASGQTEAANGGLEPLESPNVHDEDVGVLGCLPDQAEDRVRLFRRQPRRRPSSFPA